MADFAKQLIQYPKNIPINIKIIFNLGSDLSNRQFETS